VKPQEEENILKETHDTEVREQNAEPITEVEN